MDPRPLADVAQVIALQQILPNDLTDALALLDFGLEFLGSEGIPSGHQGFHAQLAYHLGDCARAASLLTVYPRVRELVRSTLELDLTNPFLVADRRDSTEWLRRFEALLPEGRLSLTAEEDRPPFDRLTADDDRTIAADPRISVVVTCFKPDGRLLTAVRSLIKQSWVNLEVLVVDDGSPAQYDSVLQQCLRLDDRVRLIKLDANAGTYSARNAGLDAASGRFITFLDSDDWSHPRRLEQQIGPLLADSSLVATTSLLLRVTDQLTFTDLRQWGTWMYRPSLLFRRSLVVQRLGYFDNIRKAADSEYIKRLEATFGPSAVHPLETVLTLYRQPAQSLSYSDFRRNWIHPARAAYRSAYELWHDHIRAGAARPYLAKRPATRPFPAPRYLSEREPDRPNTCTSYDVVLASDWRLFGRPAKSMIEESKALTRCGLQVGIMHMEACRHMTIGAKSLCAPVQELINDRTVDQVLHTEAHEAGLLVIRYPSVLQFGPFRASRLKVRRVLILANQPPSELDGTDLRYVPAACTRTAEDLFSVRPLWVPSGPQVRESLEATGLQPPELATFNMPGILDPEEISAEALEAAGLSE
jgi:glycosyltransferase involved in cell wall biosynthesis